MKSRYHKFCSWWTPARVAIFLVAICIMSLMPILYCSFYDYATGDDLNYSAQVYQLMLQGASFPVILGSMWETVIKYWHAYQGTWSSILLFQLQPGIWGERVYTVTVWIALLCLIGGTGYILYDLLVRRLHLRRTGYWAILSMVSMLSVQYMPTIRGGLFWYTSVAHYVIPYGAALLSITWARRYLDTGYRRYYIASILFMVYLGGAGYPPIVLAAVAYVLVILGGWTGMLVTSDRTALRRRAAWLTMPLALELIGFVISAVAPGNKVRGGEDFGFSAGRAATTILQALIQALTDGIGYCLSARLLVPAMLIIAVLAFETYDVAGHRIEVHRPLAVVILAYLVSAAVRAPEIYAGVEVSGGVPDVDYYVTVLCISIAVCYCMVWLRNDLYDRGAAIAMDGQTFNRCVRTPLVILAMLFCAVFYRHLIGRTADYTCMTFIRSGALADYQAQMQERLAILEDENIRDVVLPEMNEYQGPFMHMPLTGDPDAFTNKVTAEYYGKNSVIAISREEYEAGARQ